MILHRSMKITINVIRLHCNLSTIRHHANGADHKRHSSLASSRVCEWALARSMKMQKMAKWLKQTEWIITVFIVIPLVIN